MPTTERKIKKDCFYYAEIRRIIGTLPLCYFNCVVCEEDMGICKGLCPKLKDLNCEDCKFYKKVGEIKNEK